MWAWPEVALPGVHVLVVGVSVRALAESAVRAGYRVTAVDAFGDLDLEARADLIALRADRASATRFGPRAVVRRARGIACDAVVYAAGFENHPRAVRALAEMRPLWGNPPGVLRRVRDPLGLARTLHARGFAVPAARGGAGGRAVAPGTRWLLKPRASGGGHRIKSWRAGAARRLPPGTYLQEWIPGTAGSIVFAADGIRAVPLGLSRGLAGERRFGASGFRYCGNILVGAGEADPAGEAELYDRATAVAAAVTADFGLVGVNGLDFVARGGVPYVLEVNPRYTASMELVERAFGFSIFDVHARACVGVLPDFDLAAARAVPGAIGKAVLYARRDVMLGDTRPWLEDDTVRDIPHPGERIPRGRPVCTVFARGRDAATCYDALVRRAEALYRAIEPPARKTA